MYAELGAVISARWHGLVSFVGPFSDARYLHSAFRRRHIPRPGRKLQKGCRPPPTCQFLAAQAAGQVV